MHAARFFVAFALGLTATLAHAAGLRFIEVPADADGPALNGAVWYPCSEPPGKIDLGPYTLSVTKHCPLSADRLPLVVVSHGRVGSFVNLYDLAARLADAGFIVAAINHPGDTTSDRSCSDNLLAFVERPVDIKRLVNEMLGASPAAPKVDPERIGFFGFSRGGYTGLVLIGANPDWSGASAFCQQSSLRACEPIRKKEFPAQHALLLSTMIPSLLNLRAHPCCGAFPAFPRCSCASCPPARRCQCSTGLGSRWC